MTARETALYLKRLIQCTLKKCFGVHFFAVSVPDNRKKPKCCCMRAVYVLESDQ